MDEQIFQITETISVCGFQGIEKEEKFQKRGFDAHLQCVAGFEPWISKYVDVKQCFFDDCQSIPKGILDNANGWLSVKWKNGEHILISCAMGESRSVSMAINLLLLKTNQTFEEACALLFSKIPKAYPHPKVLASVAIYHNLDLSVEILRDVYSKVQIFYPFPWTDADFKEAVSIGKESLVIDIPGL